MLTSRGVAAVGSPIHSVRILQFDQDPETGEQLSHVITERGRVPIAPFLAERDIVVNCTLQDTAAPLTYLTARRPGRVPAAAAWSWTCPATRAWASSGPGRPASTTRCSRWGPVDYYAVDHSPSYLWDSATWENSLALIPFLRPVLEGAASWDADETLSRAIEIREGRVVNPASSPSRAGPRTYPHPAA